jgi:hypothetical protein
MKPIHNTKIDRPNREFSFTKSKGGSFLQTDLFFLFLNGCCINYEWMESVGAFFETVWEVYHSDALALLNGMSILRKKYKDASSALDTEHNYFKFTLLALKTMAERSFVLK